MTKDNFIMPDYYNTSKPKIEEEFSGKENVFVATKSLKWVNLRGIAVLLADIMRQKIIQVVTRWGINVAIIKWIVIINFIFWYAVLIENTQIYSRL